MKIDDAYLRIAQVCDETFASYHYELIRDPKNAYLSGDRCQLFQSPIPSDIYWRLTLEYQRNYIVLEKFAAEDLPQNVYWFDFWPVRLNWSELTEQEFVEITSECQAGLIDWLEQETAHSNLRG